MATRSFAAAPVARPILALLSGLGWKLTLACTAVLLLLGYRVEAHFQGVLQETLQETARAVERRLEGSVGLIAAQMKLLARVEGELVNQASDGAIDLQSPHGITAYYRVSVSPAVNVEYRVWPSPAVATADARVRDVAETLPFDRRAVELIETAHASGTLQREVFDPATPNARLVLATPTRTGAVLYANVPLADLAKTRASIDEETVTLSLGDASAAAGKRPWETVQATWKPLGITTGVPLTLSATPLMLFRLDVGRAIPAALILSGFLWLLLGAAHLYRLSSSSVLRATTHLRVLEDNMPTVALWEARTDGTVSKPGQLSQWFNADWSASLDWLRLVHPDERREIEVQLRQALVTAEPTRTLCRMLHRDGTYHRVTFLSSPTFSAGELSGHVGITLDLSGFDDHEFLFQSLKEFGGDANQRFWLGEPNGAMRLMGRWDSWLGLNGDSPALSTLAKAIVDEDRERVLESYAYALSRQESWTASFRHHAPADRKDPASPLEVRHVQVAAAPLTKRDGTFVGLFGTLTDITDAVQMQRELELSRAEEKAKEKYMHMLSHEVRTPLNHIKGSLALLKELTTEEGTEKEVQQWLGIAHTATGRLTEVVDRSLEYLRASFDGRGLRLKEEDLAMPAEAAVTMARVLALPKGQTIHYACSEPVVARIDMHGISRILDNLLANAVKYSPERASIHVDVRREGEQAVITVRDGSAGLTEAEIARLGEPFFRTASSRTEKGTGLGVAISRELAEAHGGSLTYANSPLGGLQATLVLPLACPLATSPGELLSV